MNGIKLFLSTSTLIMASASIFAAADIEGTWRSIDDKTGFSKGIIKITKADDGSYSGKIIEVIPRPGYTPKTTCDKCSGALKNKPILGMTVLSGMKQSSKNEREFTGGHILDPLTGKSYKSKMKLNNSGSRLNMRGYVGVEVVGRSQTWIRQD